MLAGLGRAASRRARSCSFPTRTRSDGIEASAEVECFPPGEGRQVCAETIRIQLCGNRAEVPASVVAAAAAPGPAGLPALARAAAVRRAAVRGARRRGRPADRRLAPSGRVCRRRTRSWPRSSTGWPSPTSRGRGRAAGVRSSPSLWPGIADVKTDQGRRAPRRRPPARRAGCARGSGATIALEHEPSDRLVRRRGRRRAGAVPAGRPARSRPTCSATSSTASPATASTRTRSAARDVTRGRRRRIDRREGGASAEDFAEAAERHLDDVHAYPRVPDRRPSRGRRPDSRDVRAGAASAGTASTRAAAGRARGSASSRARPRSTTSAPRSAAAGARGATRSPSCATSAEPVFGEGLSPGAGARAGAAVGRPSAR